MFKMHDIHYKFFKTTVSRELKRVLTDDERESVPSFYLLSDQNHKETAELLRISPILASSYLSYILTPDLACNSLEYVYGVLLGNTSLDEFINRHLDDK
ncbi:hypothetical protein ACO0LM_15910 [Undibacterium sp. Di26W]|uniref:hypothetical protein n=1 Tax=Undibacterium sp. Di26W TaxID=3413035 RepID=UPI003BF2B86A